MSWYRWNGDALELSLKVQPRAPRDAFVGPDPAGTYFRVRIQAPPVEGKGNLALRRFIAETFGVSPSQVEVMGGEHARYKRLRILRPRNFPIPIEPA